MFKKVLAFAPVVLLAGTTYAQGPGKALYFPATAASEHVSFGDQLSDSLGRTSFTLELWIKPANNGGDPAFFGNKDWASGANTGILWAMTSATQLKFNFRPAGGTRLDPAVTIPSLTTAWNHIAAVVNRPSNAAGSVTIYVNGIESASAVIPIADTARSLDGVMPMRLGQDGTGTYGYKFKGSMDEFRVWNTVRSAQDIRNNMCHKLTGNEAGLMAYYRMDEASGTVLTNNAVATAAAYPGTLLNGMQRVASAAALGDASVNLYAANFNGQTLNMTTTAQGNIQLQQIDTTMKGIHLYRIDAAPDVVTGIPNPGTPSAYYGVFPVNAAAAYQAVYDYSNYPAAITYEGGIDLFRRESADSSWSGWGAAKNIAANTFSRTAARRSELLVGNFMNPATCNIPTALNAQNMTISGASLSWTSGGSNRWNIAYGAGTFNPATGGTHVNDLSTAAYVASGLNANTGYTFYVQDTCASIGGASPWAGPFAFTTLPDYSQYGSGYAINFQGTAQAEHVNLGDSLSGALATTSYTLETWIRFGNNSSDPAFIGNKNWDNGQNTGILWCWNGGNNLRFNFKPAGGTRRDYDINVPNSGQWNHIAMVIDRKGYLTAYLNGVPAGTPINIAADSGKSLDGVLPIRIGQDGTGTYGPKFKGTMDELRIWNTTLSDTAIRAAMCHKLSGSEAGLMAYYRMDEASGNVLVNNATATAGYFNGALTNAPQRVVSGAAVGDSSLYIYPAAWNGVALTAAGGAYGSLTVDSVSDNIKGMHIYKVTRAPNYTDGIADIGGTATYYGVFTTNNYNTAYRVQYDYNAYPAAVTNAAGLHLYSRRNNATTPWIQLSANNNVTAKKTGKSGAYGVREFLLADFSPAACPVPSAMSVSGIDTANATLSLTAAAAGHILQYGLSGFTLGAGTTVPFTAGTYALTGLQPATTYDVYLQDSCSATSRSAWVLLSFTTADPCAKPGNAIADTLASNKIVLSWQNHALAANGYEVSWGPAGFGDPNIGIVQPASDTTTAFPGMAANTTYDFYIRTNCSSSVAHSAWAGPFSFTTLACDAPYNLAAQNVTANGAGITWITGGAAKHNLQYGPAGFSLGGGTLVANVTTTSYTLSGLQGNKAYDVYVQDSCSETLGSSRWVGPVTFTTQQGTGISSRSGNSGLKLFPNPAGDQLSVVLTGQKIAGIVLFNGTGQQVDRIEGSNHEQVDCSVKQLSSGTYFMEIYTDKGERIVSRFVVQH